MRIVALVLAVALAGSAGAELRAILISCDGLRPDAVTSETMPRLSALRAAGVSAPAVNDYPSITLPNHTSMLTGLTAARHKIVFNDTQPGHVPYDLLLDYAHAAGLRTGFFASKKKFAFLADAETFEQVEILDDIDELVQRLLAALRAADGPEVAFLHLREPDVTGHREGWMSPAYLEVIGRVDVLLGRIFDELDARVAAGAEPPFILVTADHGGIDTNHYLDLEADRRIPWILGGPDIPAGVRLGQEVATVDTTPTLLWLLGLEVPADLSGQPIRAVRDREATLARSGLPVPRIGSHRPIKYYWKQYRVLIIVGLAAAVVAAVVTVSRRGGAVTA